MIRNVTSKEQILGYDLDVDVSKVYLQQSKGTEQKDTKKTPCDYKRYLRVK